LKIFTCISVKTVATTKTLNLINNQHNVTFNNHYTSLQYLQKCHSKLCNFFIEPESCILSLSVHWATKH